MHLKFMKGQRKKLCFSIAWKDTGVGQESYLAFNDGEFPYNQSLDIMFDLYVMQ